MTIQVLADRAQTHWLVDTQTPGVLGRDHAILYVPFNPVKLGQVTRDSAEGLTPQQAFIERYGDRSAVAANIEAQDLFVIPKHSGEKFDYDDGVRELIHQLFRQGRIEFDALFPNYQKKNHNSEALIGYDPVKHRDQLLTIIKQYLGLTPGYDTKNPITWRWQQEQEIEEICTKLDQHQLCLYAAYTSRGKTKISIEVAARSVERGGIVLVTTPITDTKQGFFENIRDWHFGPSRARPVTFMDSAEFKKYSIKDLLERKNSGELIFVVLTVQDLRWGESVCDLDLAQLRTKYQSLDGHIDLWIRDERHSQYNGAVTATRLGQLSAAKELDLTATPYNCFDLYDRKHIVSRTLLWGLQNRPHTRLPEIGVDALSLAACEISDKIAELYSVPEGYDPRKMFARHGDNFLLEAEILELANRFYNLKLSRKKNPLSINNDVELSVPAKRCGMWVLPAGANGDSAGDYIPYMAQLLNTSAGKDTLWIDAYTLEDECPKGVSIGEHISNLLNGSNKRVVILTCGKFLTGTDIPALGHVVLFDKMSSIANFEQLMGRMIREWPHKDRVKLYALTPGSSLRVTLGRMAHRSSELSGGEPGDILDCVPLSEYSGTGWNTLTSTEILASVQNWFSEQVRRLIPGISVLQAIQNVDLTHWKDADISRLRGVMPKAQLTDETGAKVKDKRRKNDEPKDDDEDGKDTLVSVAVDRIREIIQNVVYEMQWVAYSMNNYKWADVVSHDAIRGMFGSDVIDAVIRTINDSSRLSNIIQDHLSIKHQAYQNLPYTDVYDELFGNSKIKQSIGLVYVPHSLALEMIANLPKKKYNRICVVNALNGMLPLALRDAYPGAEIVCGEVFPFFKHHLKNLGFEVVDREDLNDMKFDVIVGNPPYQAPKSGDYSFWARFVDQGHKMLKDNGILSMVIPAGWMSPTNDIRQGRRSVMRDIFAKNNTTYINLDPDLGRKHFAGIGQKFSVFVLENAQYKSTVLDFGNDKTIDVDLSNMPMLAKDPDEINIGIIQKICKDTPKWEFTRYIMGESWDSVVFEQTDSHQYPRINGNSNHLDKTVYTVSPCRYQNSRKVVLPYNGTKYQFVVDDGKVGCTNAYVMLLQDSINVDSAATYFESKLLQWLGKNKFTQYNEGALINSVSAMDLTHPISEKDIYDRYGLTQQEIDYIESSV